MIEVFRAVHVHGFVLLLWPPVPLVGTEERLNLTYIDPQSGRSPERVQMIVDPGPDGFPHVRVRDDSLVCPDYQEDVDEDDLVAPVIFNPETQSDHGKLSPG